MPPERQRSRAGIFWLILIFTPATLIVAGVVGLFVWQARTGTITPKWRKPAEAAAAVTPTNQSRPDVRSTPTP